MQITNKQVTCLGLITMVAIAYGLAGGSPSQSAEPRKVNCNGLQNFLSARKAYGRSALPYVCSQSFSWSGRIDCSRGLPVVKYNLSMADAEWICKKLIYARGNEIPYKELRAMLFASGAAPKTLPGTSEYFKELRCGSRLCSTSWLLEDGSTINVTVRRDGDQLAVFE